MGKKSPAPLGANVVRSWKRIIAVGCTHGEHLLPEAAEAVLEFKRRFKPHHRIHLGDAWDLPALRTGAKDTPDESRSIFSDVQAGIDFLDKYAPTVFTSGNHDLVRVDKFMDHHNAVVRELAQEVRQRMLRPLQKHKTEVHRWSIWDPWKMGGYTFTHGFSYGANYIRNTAIKLGNSVIAHGHWAGMAQADREDCATCYSVGTLADIPAMGYAETRFATQGWNHGIVYGEICEDRAQLQLHQWHRGETEWRLPL